jgi:hypothetical protein
MPNRRLGECLSAICIYLPSARIVLNEGQLWSVGDSVNCCTPQIEAEPHADSVS